MIPSRVALAAAVAAGLLACGAPDRGPGGAGSRAGKSADELETVDVRGPLDAELSTADDEQARGTGSHVAGVLPGGFPRDLPLPKPSTIIDFGPAEGGRSFVELFSPEAVTLLRPRWEDRLTAAGWSRAGAEWRRDGRRVRIRVEDATPGSRLRIEYRPG